MTTFSRYPDMMTQLKPKTGWCLTSGHDGHEQQALGILEELGIDPIVKRVNPKGPFRWLSPFAPAYSDRHINPPWPDIVVASSRLAAPYARSIRRRSKGRTFTVFLQDSGAPPSWFDFVWVNVHDRLSGSNVMKTLTAPHRVTKLRLEKDAEALAKRVLPMSGPYFSVVLGGPSNAYQYSEKEAESLAQAVAEYAQKYNYSVLVTPSRRTPDYQISALNSSLGDLPHWIWDGVGDNPYFGILGLAKEILVTCDSVNMVGEAAFTGKPLHLWKLKGGTQKFKTFHAGIFECGAGKWFDGEPSSGEYGTIDSRAAIAAEILRCYALKQR